ncbi:hypothetical protein HBI49_198500 [Parastagonospora nodorum]|nr:hypothetical protein HBI49_198500 [Parastagonospora nodorum]
MAYNPVMQGEQMQYQDPRAYPQNYEMRSLASSYTSTKGSFFSHSTPIHTDATGIHQRDHSGKWTPGFWKQFPALAILSILGILASTIASVVVLMQSHHKSLDDWGYGIAPSVYLAIASVVANALTAYALAIGLEITFWRNALRGNTLAGLNQNWLNGHSIYHALLHGLRPGGRITALACVFSVLALLRGPINQRASAVQSNVGYNTSGTLQLPVAQRIPDGYTAITFDTRSSTAMVGRLMPDFAQIMQDYSARANISMAHSDCGESCVASIKGFGFKTSCDTTDFTLEKSTTGGAFDQTIFEASTSLYPIGERVTGQTGYDNAGIRFNVTYRDSRSYRDGSSVMVMKFKSHICNLTGSTAEYKVRLSSQTISLASNRSEDLFFEDHIMPGPGSFKQSAIGGFEYAANYLFTSKATFVFVGARSSIRMTGSLANEVVRGPLTGWEEEFLDPMDAMLDKMREIAFRTAVRVGRDQPNNITDADQTTTFEGLKTRSIYVTDFRYMLAAGVLSIMSVIAISLPFHGWWQLGRTVSLSPLEIAKAFDAPILAQIGSNLDLSDSKNLGSVAGVRVQYGVKGDEQVYNGRYGDGLKRKLVMGYGGYVGRPNRGDVFGS